MRLPWAKPKDYDPARFELVARYLEEKPDVRFGQLCNPVKVPGGKTDTSKEDYFDAMASPMMKSLPARTRR